MKKSQLISYLVILIIVVSLGGWMHNQKTKLEIVSEKLIELADGANKEVLLTEQHLDVQKARVSMISADIVDLKNQLESLRKDCL